MSAEFVLTFGKHKGKTIGSVPDYARWLTGFTSYGHDIYQEETDSMVKKGTEYVRDCYMKDAPPVEDVHPRRWLKAAILSRKVTSIFIDINGLVAWIHTEHRHPDAIAAARDYFDGRGFMCHGRLVAIGSDRINGHGRPGWEGRKMHKKCWSKWQRELHG